MVEVSQMAPHRYHHTTKPLHAPFSLRPRRPLSPASKSSAASWYYQLLTPSRFVSTTERHERREKAGNRSETVRVMINPGKGDIPHNPVSSAVSFFPRTRASYKTHKKRETYHFDTVPLRPNQSFCNIDRGSEKLAQLPLPASRQLSTTFRTRVIPPSSHPPTDKRK